MRLAILLSLVAALCVAAFAACDSKSSRPADNTPNVSASPTTAAPPTAVVGGQPEPLSGVKISAIDAVGDARVWTARGAMLFVSDDAGASWSELGELPSEVRSLSFVDELRGWATTSEHGLFSTDDGGYTWAPRRPGQWGDVQFVDPSTGWLVTAGQGVRLERTQDGGDTWKELSAPCDDQLYGHLSFFSAQDGWLGCGGQGASVMQVSQWYYTTSDGGSTWQLAGGFDLLAATTVAHPQLRVDGHLTDVFAIDEQCVWLGSYRASAQTIGCESNKSIENPGGGAIDGIVFVSATRGYALENGLALLRTDDGGLTWCTVHDLYEARRDLTYPRCP